MSECNHFMSGPFCMLCGQPADEPCPSSCGVGSAEYQAAQRAENERYRAMVDAVSHPKAQEPAVSDAAYKAHWGNDSPVVSERERMHRVEVEMTFQGTGCVLRTREEWDERGKEAHEGPLKALAAHQSAELASLRAQLRSIAKERERLFDMVVEAEKERDQALDRIERMRPAFPGPSYGALLLQSPSDHRLGSGPGDTDTTYREPKPVIRTRPML